MNRMEEWDWEGRPAQLGNCAYRGGEKWIESRFGDRSYNESLSCESLNPVNPGSDN